MAGVESSASSRAERDFMARGLSERERAAARSVLAGMTAEEAARRMGLRASTVGAYRRRAYRKLGVSGARELAARYGENDDARAAELGKRLGAFGLSATQAAVLARVIAGQSTADIARDLNVAPGTVNAARASGYRLMGVHSRAQLVDLLERERDAATQRERRGRRRAAACVTAALACAVVLGLALTVLPVDAAGALLGGECAGMSSVNGVLFAVNKAGDTFGSVRRARLPMSWEDIERLSPRRDAAKLFELHGDLPDLIAVAPPRYSTSCAEPGYVRKDDVLFSRGEDCINVYEANGERVAGTIAWRESQPR